MLQAKPAGSVTIVPITSPAVLAAPAGGLTRPLARRFLRRTWGLPGYDELLVGWSSGGYGTTYQYGQLVSSVSQLTPGDVIGYDWDGSGNGSMSGIDHTVIYVGNNTVDCHATSHLGANWTLGGADDYFFIHITLHDSIVPTTPSNNSPANNTSMMSLTPTLVGHSFVDTALGSSQIATEWELFKGGSLVYDTGTDTKDLTSLAVPSGKLVAGNSYTWQVRYEDNYSDWSSYSTPTAFATAPDYPGSPPPLPPAFLALA